MTQHGPVEATVETPLHRAPAECKVLATILFAVAVALIPRGQLVWPYALDAALLLVVAALARTPVSLLGGRLMIELPFVLFVVLLPVFSPDGWWLAFSILAKATLVVLATGVLSWTTPPADILRGLDRLGAPRQLTAIAGFALRYLQLLLDDLRRMRLARALRGDDPRWLWQARSAARTAGTVALRAFERGERVHTAMLARGYDGRMPSLALVPRAAAGAWAVALVVPVAAAAVLVAARGWL